MQGQGVCATERGPGSGCVCVCVGGMALLTARTPAFFHRGSCPGEGGGAGGGGVCGYCRSLSLHQPLPSFFSLLQAGQEDFLSPRQEGGRPFLSAGGFLLGLCPSRPPVPDWSPAGSRWQSPGDPQLGFQALCLPPPTDSQPRSRGCALGVCAGTSEFRSQLPRASIKWGGSSLGLPNVDLGFSPGSGLPPAQQRAVSSGYWRYKATSLWNLRLRLVPVQTPGRLPGLCPESTVPAAHPAQPLPPPACLRAVLQLVDARGAAGWLPPPPVPLPWACPAGASHVPRPAWCVVPTDSPTSTSHLPPRGQGRAGGSRLPAAVPFLPQVSGPDAAPGPA